MLGSLKHFSHLGDLSDVELGGGSTFTVRQDMIFALPFPVYINETASRQEMILSTYVNET